MNVGKPRRYINSRIRTRYNLSMRLTAALAVLVLATTGLAQSAPHSEPQPKSVTVPIKVDHNRIVIDVDLPLPDGSTRRVRGWVDNGNPDFWMNRRVAELMGLAVTCESEVCLATPKSPAVPLAIMIRGMKVFLPAITEIKIPAGAPFVAPGLNAEINIPSTVLRNYDVLINFPDQEFTIAQPRTLKFNGVKAKVIVNGENGLIQVPSQIENKKYNLALDLGSSISFLADELFNKFAAAHPDRPHMTGAIGPANMWGLPDEPKWKLTRLDRVQYGPLFLTNVAMVQFPGDRLTFFEKRAGIPSAGLLGASALLNYRVGLDYAHSTVYFDIGRTFNFPDFDVIGLILRPENDGLFTILGIADYDGKPSVPEGVEGVQAGDHIIAVDGIPVSGSTMGQAWSQLGGEPGTERTLTIERAGKQFAVAAKVQHFLGETSENSTSKGNSSRN
jgi:hypothetical protein